MKNLKISTKLFILTGLLSVVMIIIGLYGLYNIQQIDKGIHTMYEDRVIPLEQLKKVSDAYAVKIVDAAQKARAGAYSWNQALQELEEATEIVTKNWNSYSKTKIEGREKQLAEEAVQLRKTSKLAVEQIRTILRKGKSPETQVELEDFIDKHMYDKIDPYTDKISELMHIQLTISNQIKNDADALLMKTRFNSSLLLIFGLGFSVLFAVFIIRNINSSDILSV
jgi:hypothetical protein